MIPIGFKNGWVINFFTLQDVPVMFTSINITEQVSVVGTEGRDNVTVVISPGHSTFYLYERGEECYSI
jgi:hypothetical protein